MFLMDGFSTVRPLAVVSHGEHTRGQNALDPDVVFGQLIAPTLQRWGLTLLAS